MISSANLQRARAYHSAVSHYDVTTVERMVREDYIQHNPRVPTGRAAFVALLPILKKHDTKIENVRIFEDGPHVIMHHLWRNAIPFGANEKVAFHIIRFDVQGLIAEHWSVMMDNLAGRSLIDGPTEIEDWNATEENKAKTVELFGLLIEAKVADFERSLPGYFASSYLRHIPEAGCLGLGYDRQHMVFGAGNFVLSICEGTTSGMPAALYDLFRFEKGKIAEHWSVYQEIPRENIANDNTMFNF